MIITELLSASHYQKSLFLSHCNQQMVAGIEPKSFNQIGQANFAATVTDIQLIEFLD